MMIRRQPVWWYNVYTHTQPLSTPPKLPKYARNDIQGVIRILSNEQSATDISLLKIPQLRHGRGNYLHHTTPWLLSNEHHVSFHKVTKSFNHMVLQVLLKYFSSCITRTTRSKAPDNVLGVSGPKKFWMPWRMTHR